MDYLILNDRFSLNSHDYLLKTTDDTREKRIELNLFRQGEPIYTSHQSYNPTVSARLSYEVTGHVAAAALTFIQHSRFYVTTL